MNDRSSTIFGNPVPPAVVRKAERAKAGYVRKYGDDSGIAYPLVAVPNPSLEPDIGLMDVLVGRDGRALDPATGLAIGTIRMGFGHYRAALAVASAARSRGRIPYLFDLLSFRETTGAKVIGHLNELYSMGSRLSQRFPLFDKLFWDPLNSEGFKKLSQNASDQKVAELMAPVCRGLPDGLPFVSTHPWPAQAALHAGRRGVVNMVLDNWPMALHLAEGALHLVQGPSSWAGYRVLREFGGADTALSMMPPGSVALAGHFVDHEIVSNIEADCGRRLGRMKAGKPRRLLLSVGGAGAQRAIFASILRDVMPDVEAGKVAVFVNVGDHRAVWDGLVADVRGLAELSTLHFDDWPATRAFCGAALDGDVTGVHAFYHADIFAAVYASNLLMRACDVLATKPSEFSFYPVPKLFIRRVGGHEAWGAIRSAELGDGTFECGNDALVGQALDLFLRDDELLPMMCSAIVRNKAAGVYDGAYRAADLAVARAGG